MREKLRQFMAGRYGTDDFSRFLVYAALACMILSLLFDSAILNAVILALIVYAYYRMLSRDHQKRYEENVRFLEAKGSFKSWFSREKYLLDQKKEFRIYTCPGCKQKIRIPKGKGRIVVKCPKCQQEFTKRS